MVAGWGSSYEPVFLQSASPCIPVDGLRHSPKKLNSKLLRIWQKSNKRSPTSAKERAQPAARQRPHRHMGWIDHGNSLYPDKAKIFMRDQIENLKLWRNLLQNQIAFNWKTGEDSTEEQIRFLLDSKSFQKDGIYHPMILTDCFQLKLLLNHGSSWLRTCSG